MRFYELVLIARQDVADEGIKELLDKTEKLLKKKKKKAEKGEVLHCDDWGVRKFAHPLQKQSQGHYLILTIKCLPETLEEVERHLRLMDEVVRFQSVRLENEPEFEKAAPEKESVPEEKAEEVSQEVETEAQQEAGDAAGA